MRAQLKEIDSVGTLIAAVTMFPPGERRLYRGQPLDQPLLPRFAREAKRHDLAHPLVAERRLLRDFSALSIPYLAGARPQSTYEWLAIAQHHGLPTRLLDWTGNPLAALWFAVRNGLHVGEDYGAFWVLEVQEDQLIPLAQPEIEVFELRQTRVFRPAHVTRRIVAQDGWFTAHWYVEAKGKFIPLERQPRFRPFLRKYRIPQRNVDRIRAELLSLGLSEAVLFPELAATCAALTQTLFPRAAAGTPQA